MGGGGGVSGNIQGKIIGGYQEFRPCLKLSIVIAKVAEELVTMDMGVRAFGNLVRRLSYHLIQAHAH